MVRIEVWMVSQNPPSDRKLTPFQAACGTYIPGWRRVEDMIQEGWAVETTAAHMCKWSGHTCAVMAPQPALWSRMGAG